jgi:hypothetical protein
MTSEINAFSLSELPAIAPSARSYSTFLVGKSTLSVEFTVLKLANVGSTFFTVPLALPIQFAVCKVTLEKVTRYFPPPLAIPVHVVVFELTAVLKILAELVALPVELIVSKLTHVPIAVRPGVRSSPVGDAVSEFTLIHVTI